MQMNSITQITKAIQAHAQNKAMKAKGYKPIFTADLDAKVVIIGQAPGIKAQESAIPWNDKSGEQLRRWLGVSDEDFYNPKKIALMPMDFYFPGKGKSGDLPPRKGFAELWHPPLLELMPDIELTILIGQYAQAYYLEDRADTLTQTVKNYKTYMKRNVLALPHPSPRNNIWKAKNPWFEDEVVPVLQRKMKTMLV